MTVNLEMGCGGRMMLVGCGHAFDPGVGAFGEQIQENKRAQRLA